MTRRKSLFGQSHPSAEVRRGVVGLVELVRLEAHRSSQPVQEARVGEEASVQAVPFRKGRRGASAPPPLEGDHVQRRQPLVGTARVDRMLGEDLERLASPCFGGTRRGLGLGSLGLRAQDRIAVLEERVGVCDAVVGPGRYAESGLPAAEMVEREAEAVHLELRARGDEPRRVVFVLPALAGAARQPEPVVAPLGGTQRREGEHVGGVDLLSRPERLEDGAAGKLLRRVAEHRPVSDLAGRGPAGADAVDEAARAFGRDTVEVRRVGGLVRGAPAERVVSAVGEPVEEDDEDRIHGAEANGTASRNRPDRVTHVCAFRH